MSMVEGTTKSLLCVVEGTTKSLLCVAEGTTVYISVAEGRTDSILSVVQGTTKSMLSVAEGTEPKPPWWRVFLSAGSLSIGRGPGTGGLSAIGIRGRLHA